MGSKDLTQNEAEYAGYVDRGTQAVLQDAIKKILDTFSQTDALEDILGYLEEMRENLQNSDERMKEIQQREKQISTKVTSMETSTRNLLQRIQTMEVQLIKACEQVETFGRELERLTNFFEKSPLARMVSRLEVKDSGEEMEFADSE